MYDCTQVIHFNSLHLKIMNSKDPNVEFPSFMDAVLF